MMKRSFSSLLVLGAATALLTGCANWKEPGKWFDFEGSHLETTGKYFQYIKPYRPDVHQGNLITREMINELKVGMTSSQVAFLLGQPLLKDEFHKSRWDYVYYVNPRIGEPEKRRLTVFFDETDRLKSFTYNEMPSEADADKIILGSKEEFRATSSEMTVVDKP